MTDVPSEQPQLPEAFDLRQASDLLMTRLDRLYELEHRKRELAPDHPEFTRLAREVEDVSRSVLGASGLQVELAEEVAAAAKRDDVDVQPIRDTPPGSPDAVTILTDWRAAERRLAAAPPDSREERVARAEIDRLREAYRRILDRPS